jgi:ABC-type molybdate transport system substrate-binding protein
MAKEKSSHAMLLLVLLGLIAGAGGWNYRRNVAIEAAEPRPYGSYSLEDLESLKSAYESETSRHKKNYRAASSRKVEVRDGGLIGDQVVEFERVQRISRGKRDIASVYAKNQVQLDEVLAEINYRARAGEGWMLHLTRLTKYP